MKYFKGKKILILGAGVYQLPLIKKSKQMGLKTIVVSRKGNYPGFKISDKNYFIDTIDSDAVLKVALKENILGICTSGTDVPLFTLGTVAEEMGLPGISKEAAALSTNKLLMKEAFLKKGVRSSTFVLIKNINIDDVMKIKSLNFPIIFKVVDSSGSRGIIKVEDEAEIKKALKIVIKNTKLGYFIAEEFLKGMELGAQAFVFNGEVKFILPHGDFVFKGDTGVPVGHFVPLKLKEEVLTDLKNQIKMAITALKLTNCAINADFILRKNRVYVLEIGARAGATCLPEMVSIYYGIDYYREIIKASLGKKPHFSDKTAQPNASILLYSEKSGIIKELRNDNIEDERIIEIKFDYIPGQKINKFRVGPDRVGHVIVKDNSLKECLILLKKVKKNIKIELMKPDE